MNSWFTSDWHLDHTLMLKLFRKESSVSEMNNRIINKYKELVKPGDNFYFLGDLGFNNNIIKEFFDIHYVSNTNFYWILGNHDQKYMPLIRRLESDITNLRIKEQLSITIDNQSVFLNHYPMITWNKSHYGAWQLYGHHHIDYSGRPDNFVSRVGKQINVSVDLFPDFLEWNEIKKLMINEKDNWDLTKKLDL